jgi:UDP-N-acetylglucosamine acyltransferase
MKAHPTALVDPAAEIAADVEIGPFCVVGPGVKIGEGSSLGPRVCIHGPAVLGRNNRLHAHSSVGTPGSGRVEIGDDNVIRESTTITSPDAKGLTKIGSRNRFGTWVSVGPGSVIGDDARLGSFSVLAENCLVGSGARIEGQTVIEPGMKIGAGCRIRSQVPVAGDVADAALLDGNPAQAQSGGPV